MVFFELGRNTKELKSIFLKIIRIRRSCTTRSTLRKSKEQKIFATVCMRLCAPNEKNSCIKTQRKLLIQKSPCFVFSWNKKRCRPLRDTGTGKAHHDRCLLPSTCPRKALISKIPCFVFWWDKKVSSLTDHWNMEGSSRQTFIAIRLLAETTYHKNSLF